MWYFEQAGIDGSWEPVTTGEKPVVKNGRLARGEGMGPRVRGVLRVPRIMRNDSLSTLQTYLSEDGPYRHVHKRAIEEAQVEP